MISFPELLSSSKEKTRVVIYSENPLISKLVLEILNFSGKEYDFLLHSGICRHNGNDFVIFETENLDNAATFSPTILFISDGVATENISLLLKNITPGGIAVYPHHLENQVEESPHFFRKIPFKPASFKKEEDQYVFHSDMGAIPVLFQDENLLSNLDGIKLLCQQFGVMEEELYEPVMNFE